MKIDTPDVEGFIRAYDEWAKSEEPCGGELFDEMLRQRDLLGGRSGKGGKVKIDTPDVFELLKSALIAGGYDGLFDDSEDDCGCLVDRLCPCRGYADGISDICRAGWKHVDENGNWYVSRVKEEK